MSTPIVPSSSTASASTPYTIRSPRQELEAFTRRRLESLRRVDSDAAELVEAGLKRALELLEEAETDDDPD